MVTQREAMDVIAGTLQRHASIPDDMSYLIREADPDGVDAGVSVPLIELQDIVSNRDDPSNSNLVGYITNESDERVGYVFETKWEMQLQMDIWTVDGSDRDVDSLGKRLKEVLYTYDSRGPDKTFLDDDGTPVEGIYDFSLQDAQRNDSLVETHSVRKWRQNARVRGAEELRLTEEKYVIKQATEDVDNNDDN